MPRPVARRRRVSGYWWIAAAIAVSAWLGWRGVRIWQDAGQYITSTSQRARWALIGSLLPARYWWGERIAIMPAEARAELLANETRALGLQRADSLRCPLCGAEVPGAWALTSSGNPTVARGPVRCPNCDFRLDACRHCTHFLPGQPGTIGPQIGGEDLTYGRCSQYKSHQPVELACTPEMAKQLKKRGIDEIRAPLPIVDSFMPPDYCRAFEPHVKRLRAGGVAWPDARRAGLLRLLARQPVRPEPEEDERPAGEDQWLL